MSRPLLLDLFCGAGLGAVGYWRAGFDPIGVDLDPAQLAQYPFPCLRGDATDPPVDWSRFAAVHASPPCQAYTTMGNRTRLPSPDLIAATLALLRRSGLPWIVENVVGARRLLPDAVTLSGGMFGLGVHRPRLFASNVLIMSPGPTPPPANGVGVYGARPDGRRLWKDYRAAYGLEQAHAAMGADHADWRGTAEGIPPAYTEYVGRQLLAAVS